MRDNPTSYDHLPTTESGAHGSPSPLQSEVFDVRKTANTIENEAKAILHTPERSAEDEKNETALRETVRSLSPEHQKQVAAQIVKDNGNFNSLPNIDLSYADNGEISGMVIRPALLDFNAKQGAKGVNIKEVPIEPLPGLAGAD
jgi:hypothetical protein